MKRILSASAIAAVMAAAPAALPAQSPSPAAARPATTPGEAEALGMAAMQGDVATVKALLAKGVDPNTKTGAGKTPLRMATSFACSMPTAVEKDVATIVDALIAAGANVNHVDDFGLGELLMASQKCKAAVVKRMLEAGAEMDQRSPQGYSPLAMALIVSNYAAAGALVDHGARLSAESMKKIFPEPPADPEVAALVKKGTARPSPAPRK